MSEIVNNFGGLRVAAFESRNAGEMAKLITKFGGVPFVSPSMRETRLEQNPAAIDFAHRLITGEVTVVVFLTGVGFRYLVETIERHIDRQRCLNTLADIVTVARGPKPAAAMKEVGLQPTHRVHEPNTWREILTTFDLHIPVANQLVAIQEYGKSNPSLIAGLEARGARVLQVPVYRWEMPEDTGPLERNVTAIAAGELDVLMFTSANQVIHLMTVAERNGIVAQVRKSMGEMVVVSVGPTTSEMLRDQDLPVDVEPEHPKMGPMVAAAAERSTDLLRRKRPRHASLVSARPLKPSQPQPAWYDSVFMRACRHEPTEYTPVWLMRQAGRYMAEYRSVRAKTSFLELCKDPGLCSEVMVTAVKRLGVDAAILFSDLLPILEPMGLELEFEAGEGPVIHNPIREARDVDRVQELQSMEPLAFVTDAVKQTRQDLPLELPLIGFAGAPFTLASYAIEGGSSRSYAATKSLMYRDSGAWKALMEKLARSVTLYLNAQIAAGVQCVQIFDSWVGCLGPDDYQFFVLPYVRQIVEHLTPGVPVINFATGNPALLPCLAAAGAPVIGVDWRVRLDDAWRTVGYDKAVQGNLDPVVLLAEPTEIRTRVRHVLDQAGGRTGHIFNLGHGILPQTPVEHAIELVRSVHELSSRAK